MLTPIFFSLSSLQSTLQTIVVECFVSCCVVLFLHTNQITTHHNTRPFTEKYAESSSVLARQTACDNNQECVLPIVSIKTLQVSSERLMQNRSLCNTRTEKYKSAQDKHMLTIHDVFWNYKRIEPTLREVKIYWRCRQIICMFKKLHNLYGCLRQGSQIWDARAAKFCAVAPDICVSPVWNLLGVILLTCKILKRFL